LPPTKPGLKRRTREQENHSPNLRNEKLKKMAIGPKFCLSPHRICNLFAAGLRQQMLKAIS